MEELPGTTAQFWANQTALLRDYYLNDWGHAKHNDRELFEYLTLEIFSAGLNWQMMLKKRAAFAAAFANYHLPAIAQFDDSDVERLVTNPSIVRNRLKITSIIANAAATKRVTAVFGSFATFTWSFTSGEQLVTRPTSDQAKLPVPPIVDEMTKAMKKYGFRFVGPSVVYNYLQAVGVIDNHVVVPTN